jgi:hypothetical protein
MKSAPHIWIIAILVLAACKPNSPENKGGVKSIDTMLQNQEIKDRGMRCGPSTEELETYKTKPEFVALWEKKYDIELMSPMTEDDAKRLLAVVPPFIQENILAKSKIVFASDADQRCNTALQKVGRWTPATEVQLADLRGCWYEEPQKPLTLIFSSDWLVATNSLLPIVGQAFLNSFRAEKINAAKAEGKLTEKQVNDSYAVLASFKTSLAALGRGFLADIKANKELEEEARKGLIDRYTAIYGLNEDTDTRFRALGIQVFVETLDSYYCSSSSQNVLTKKSGAFPKTWAEFEPLVEILGKSWI